MRCESCSAPVAAITIGSGIDAITMGSCEHCSTRVWRKHGEVIDLTDAIDVMRSMPSRPSAPPPVGTTTARQLLQSGLPPRRVAAALIDELGLDDRAAHAALAAALQGANNGAASRGRRTSV